MAHSIAPQLHKITSLVKFTLGCELFDIRGLKDTPQKMFACYLAKKCTSASDKQIAAFFNIYVKYMNNLLEDFKIDLLLDRGADKTISQVENLFLELELADAGLKF